MIEPAQMFTVFFVTLGPLKVLGPFAQRTRGLDDATTRKIAWWAFLIAALSAVMGGLLGSRMLVTWHVSIPAVTLAGGIIFLLVGLRQLLEQYETAPHPPPPTEPLPSSPLIAGSRLVFPIVLTPYGIAAVIALLARSSQFERTGIILGLLLIVMILDLVAMWFARRILIGFVAIVLQVLGAVLAVMQVALSVEFILAGLRALGVLGPGVG